MNFAVLLTTNPFETGRKVLLGVQFSRMSTVLLTAVVVWWLLLRTAFSNDCKELWVAPAEPSGCWHSWCSTHALDHFHKLLCIPLPTHVGCTDYLLFQRLNHVPRTKAGSWQEEQPCLHRQSASMAKTHTLKSTYFPINGQSQRSSSHELMWA